MKKVLNISALLGLALFLICFPVQKPMSTSNNPEVKAAIFTGPLFPTSKGITPPQTTATGVFVLDDHSDTVLYEKNLHTRLNPASLTKIMTALVAMDHFADDELLTVINGHHSNGNTVDLIGGDILTAKDLFFALLVPSGNDAALTFAENYPGGYQNFIDKMNTKSVEMGLTNTHFVNVSGVESQDHYTSAYDITTLTRTALKRPQFSLIVQTKEIEVSSLKGNRYSLFTTNQLLGQYGVVGVKTGWTPEAGECLVLLIEKDNRRIIITLLGSQDRFGEAKSLIDWVFENFSWK